MSKILGEDIKAYHANEAISHSKLSEFMDSALGFYNRYVGKITPPETGAHFDIGSAFHARMEGLDQFWTIVSVNDKFDNWRTTEAKAWKAAQEAAGKLVLSPQEVKDIEIMAMRTNAHPDVKSLLEGTESEVTWRKSFGKWSVQARTDRYKPGTIVDFKTVPSLSDFKKNSLNYHYHTQAVFYQEVVAACLDFAADAPRPEVTFVACEKEQPFEVQPFRFGEKSMEVARAEVMTALRDLRSRFESGIWTRPAGIEIIDLPYWYTAAAEKKLLAAQERLKLNP